MSGISVSLCPESRFRSLRIGGFHYPGFRVYSGPVYSLALSPKAIQQEIGMPPSTYRDQLRKLESLGYLVPGKGNVYHFYEKPVHDTRSQSTEGALNSSGTADVQPSTAHVYETPPENIEIYINTKEKIDRPGEMNNKVAQISEREYLKRQFDAQW